MNDSDSTKDDQSNNGSDRTRLGRMPERGKYDFETIAAIIDQALVCHIGIALEDGPFVLPTLHARDGNTLILHGSAASQMLRKAKNKQVCVNITIIDGLVLARTAFHHSANYRSVVIYGKATPIDDLTEKAALLDKLTEQIVPGRVADLRAHTEKELRATTVLTIPLTESSAKLRTGGPKDDQPDYQLPVWAGTIPIETVFGPPETDPLMELDIDPPDYVVNYRR